MIFSPKFNLLSAKHHYSPFKSVLLRDQTIVNVNEM